MTCTNQDTVHASASTTSSNVANVAFAGGREIRVFLPPTSSTSSNTLTLYPAPSEDDLKPTAAELSHAFRSSPLLRAGPDAPLLTRALREREESRLGLNSSRNRTYASIRIRIRFSDRTMIESTFSETDTIDAVYAVLLDSLDETVKHKGVVIYTSPPRIEYKKSDPSLKRKTLRDLGLIPSAVVNLKWDDPHLNSNALPAPLRSDLTSAAQPLPLPSSPTSPPSTQLNPHSNSNSVHTPPSKPVPKWLKNIVSKSSIRPTLQ